MQRLWDRCHAPTPIGATSSYGSMTISCTFPGASAHTPPAEVERSTHSTQTHLSAARRSRPGGLGGSAALPLCALLSVCLGTLACQSQRFAQHL
jgi:hypothetical protein